MIFLIIILILLIFFSAGRVRGRPPGSPGLEEAGRVVEADAEAARLLHSRHAGLHRPGGLLAGTDSVNPDLNQPNLAFINQ